MTVAYILTFEVSTPFTLLLNKQALWLICDQTAWQGKGFQNSM